MTYLEHANITVDNPEKTADILVKLFDWTIRWQGPAMNDGYTVHVGSEHDYLALYTNESLKLESTLNKQAGQLNHVGLVVNDLHKAVARAKTLGFKPFNFGDYAPGNRFYIKVDNSLELEIISYQDALDRRLEMQKRSSHTWIGQLKSMLSGK